MQPPKETAMARRTETPIAPHTHHWMIDEANGPQSEGRCKRCGAEKAFKNWLEASDFITSEERRRLATSIASFDYSRG